MQRPETEIALLGPVALVQTSEVLRTVSLPADQNPLLVYLARLSSGSHRSVLQALRAMAERLMPGTKPENVPWHLLRYPHVALLRSWLQQQSLAPATMQRYLAALRGVLREAFQLGLLEANEYHRAIAFRAPKGSRLLRGRALSSRELSQLFSACASGSARDARDAALLALLYGAGLRRSEAAALQREQIEGDCDALRVRGKGNVERRVPLPGGARRALQAWLAFSLEKNGPLLRAVRGDRVLETGLGSQSVLDALKRIAERAGVDAFSPHDLRRTYVGDLLDAGADLATVQKLAGHASVTTTARYDRRGERAAARAADLLRVPF